ncbi:MAG: hypothetical protein ACFUZC_07260 [Chthoniobacteraceae bacterium]
MSYRAIEWTRHAKTTVVVDDLTSRTGFRVVAEAQEPDGAALIVAALNVAAVLKENDLQVLQEVRL